MGMFDTILVPCPKCGAKSGFQSKSGSCCLYEFELEATPADAMEDVMRHGPATCGVCATVYGIFAGKSVEWPPPDMEDEYDFSKAVKGKFFRPGATVKLPSTEVSHKHINEIKVALDDIEKAIAKLRKTVEAQEPTKRDIVELAEEVTRDAEWLLGAARQYKP